MTKDIFSLGFNVKFSTREHFQIVFKKFGKKINIFWQKKQNFPSDFFSGKTFQENIFLCKTEWIKVFLDNFFFMCESGIFSSKNFFFWKNIAGVFILWIHENKHLGEKHKKFFRRTFFFHVWNQVTKMSGEKHKTTFFYWIFFRVKPSGKKKLSGEFYFQSASKMSWSWSIKWNKQKHSSTSELYFHSIWISAATRVFQDSFCLCLIHTSSALLLTYLFPKKNFKMKLSVEKGAEWNAVLRVCEIDPVWVWRRRPAGSINPDCSLQSGLHLFKVCFSQQDSTSLFCSI